MPGPAALSLRGAGSVVLPHSPDTMLMPPESCSWSGRAGARVVTCQQVFGGSFHLCLVRFYAVVFLMLFPSEAW